MTVRADIKHETAAAQLPESAEDAAALAAALLPVDWRFATDPDLTLVEIVTAPDNGLDSKALGLGESLETLVEVAADLGVGIEAALAAGLPFARARCRWLGSDRARWVRIAAVPRRDGQGRFAGYVGIAVELPEPGDDTDRQLMGLVESLLEEKDQLELQLAGRGEEALGARLRALAHELRGPLTAILGFAEVIRSRAMGNDLDRYVEYAGDIHAAGLHLLDLVEHTLKAPAATAAAARPAPRVDAVQIADEAQRQVRLKAERAGLALAASLPALRAPVRAEPRDLRQILLNLLDNAVKYTPRGGRVELSVALTPDAVAVAVADTGPGIPPEERERVFERNYRLRRDPTRQEAEGSGLGLAIARELARRMGGDLAVFDAPGGGARFVLSLPRAES